MMPIIIFNMIFGVLVGGGLSLIGYNITTWQYWVVVPFLLGFSFITTTWYLRREEKLNDKKD